MEIAGIQHRGILFRGRQKGGTEWFEGDLSYLVHDKRRCYIFPQDGYNSPDYYEVDPDTVGQYIGVTDKHRVRLYDGDIVETKYGRVCLIIWRDNMHRWDLVPVARLNCKEPDEWDLWWSSNLEKLGNRWDNPELLEAKR